jgi:protocatechuate 3,4-dioxygenase beta subunit
MDNDDRQVGRVLSRREVLRLIGSVAGATFLAACASGQTSVATPTSGVTPTLEGSTATPTLNAESSTAVAQAALPTTAATAEAQVTQAAVVNATAGPGCVVRPEMTVGPYFVDEQLNRSDIRSEPSDNSVKEGVPLVLTFSVAQVANSACTPLSGAQVDVWHCDAEGVYSGVNDPRQGGDNTTTQFLRGWQQTGADGTARFTTIYPGWYPGRTAHIHFKIRTAGPADQTYDFTSQLFFDDALTDQVYASQPYAAMGQRSTTNTNDGIYRNGGDQLTLAPTGDISGFAATFNIALDLSDTATGQ